MVSFRRRALAAALGLACLVAFTGCEYAFVTMKLPTYFSSGIDEIWFWRLNEQGQGYVRSGYIRVGGLSGAAGQQVLQYTIVGPDGTEGGATDAVAAVESDAITVTLTFTRSAPHAWFRVSARNEAGESPLSASEVFL
jgi:hypothetical protein